MIAFCALSSYIFIRISITSLAIDHEDLVCPTHETVCRYLLCVVFLDTNALDLVDLFLTTLCLKKVPTFYTFVMSSDFQSFCTAGKCMNFATKPGAKF